MIQEIIVPIAYFLFFLLIIGNTRFFTCSSVSKRILFVAFSLKAFCAILYGYLFRSGLLTGDDTYLYFYNGNVVYGALKSNPLIYLQLALGANDFKPVPQHLLMYTDNMHFWFDKANYFLVRLNALIRLFSFGIYNVHAIVFSFLSFIGIYNLYLFFESRLNNKRLLQFILFGIPSVVFWTSGIHKEAITIFGLGLILYNLDRISMKKYSVWTFLFLFTGVFFLGYVRFYSLMILFPLAIAMLISKSLKPRIPSIFIYLLTGCVFILIAILIDLLSPEINLMKELFIRRDYFLRTIPGNMTFPIITNVPHNLSGYSELAMEAIVNPILRPFPSECKGYLPVLACVETWMFIGVIFYLLCTLDFKSFIRNSGAIFSVLFGLSTLFLIGLIVNNSGAIVRYRSIAIPFILIGLCLSRKETQANDVNSN